MKPQILVPDSGYHNGHAQTRDRLIRGKGYKDLSTVCVIPSRGMISAKVVQSWLSLLTPMNQQFVRFFVLGMEVGEAYNSAIETILATPGIKDFNFLLTMEEDNAPPPDGLLKLYEGIEDYAVVGGLYWTKGEAGQPMIYGNPREILNFRPQVPEVDGLQRCWGLGMGFTLFRMELFKDSAIPKPWFKTIQEYTPNVGVKMYSQDLAFFEQLARLGYKVACDTRVRVGHWDGGNEILW